MCLSSDHSDLPTTSLVPLYSQVAVPSARTPQLLQGKPPPAAVRPQDRGPEPTLQKRVQAEKALC